MAAMNFMAPTVLFFLAVSLSLWSPYPPGELDKQPKVPSGQTLPSLASLESFYPGLSASTRRSAIYSRPPFCLALSLLLISGSVELNPGPVYKFPCGFCSKPVKSNQTGVQCDSFDKWYHVRCIDMPTEVYHGLNNSYTSWICCTCGLPNFSSSLFKSSSFLSSSNSFDPLSDSSLDYPGISFPTPLGTSSPLQGESRPTRPPSLETLSRSSVMCPIGSQTKKGFSPKILVSNIEGARSKSAELSCILGEENIDILLATETHLNPQVNSCEILPQDFLVYRKDRPSHKGGVLIAVKNNLVSIPRPGLDSDCEIVWCEVLLDKETNLLCSYYRQESLGMISLDALDNFLSKVTKLAGNRHVILTGDFNLPSIDWATSSVPLVQKMQTSAGVYLILLMISILSNGSMSLQDTAPLLLTLWICGDLEPRAQYEQNLPLF